MRVLITALVAAMTLIGVARAAPSTQDKAAIIAMEGRLQPSAANLSPMTLSARMAALKVPGVSIAFIEGGRVKWVRAYGVADVTERRPVTPDTLFQAASMSKMVAAAGALRLVEQGRLDLDGDVNLRLKSWQVPTSVFSATQKVTMRPLLSHTAGLTVNGFPGYAAGKPVPTIVQVLDGVAPANTPAVRAFEAPGGDLAYSGVGYTVAQLATVEAGGAPYPQLLDRLVLKPAGMRHSTLAQPLPETMVPRAASCHDRKGDVIPGRRNVYPEYAAASLWTTPSDYGRFLVGLQNAYTGRRPAFLRQSSVRTMATPVSAGYGLGADVKRRGGRPALGHGGSNAGFQCLSFAFLDGSRQGAVIMTNGDAGGALAGEVMQALAKAYGWGDTEVVAVPFRRAPFVAAAPK